MKSLRHYQTGAIEAALDGFRQGLKRVLVECATGTGKTVLFSEMARRCRAKGGNVLIINERETLVRQIAENVAEWCKEPVGVEMAESRDLSSPTMFSPSIVCASIQSLSGRFSAIPFTWPTFIVIDEAHHAVAATYRKVLDYFSRAFVLGVTATADRGDNVALGHVFQKLVYRYPIFQGIKDGFLSPIRQCLVRTKIDFSRVRVTAGDLNAGDLDELLRREEALAQIADPIIRESQGRPTMVFAVSVEHTYDLARALNQRSGNENFAIGLDGSVPIEDRKECIRDVKAGKYSALVSCDLFIEGFDWPAVECVAIARPTKSRAKYTQMVGRGTRLSPGKSSCLILDFAGNSDRLQLMTAVDIFAGDVPEDVLKIAKKKAETDPRDLPELIEEARVEVRGQVLYELIERDPFVGAVDTLSLARSDDGTPATVEQKKRLLKDGFRASNVERLSFVQAEALLERVKDREARGLCTVRQARQIAKAGIDPEHVTKAVGNALTIELVRAGFRVTPDVRRRLAAKMAVLSAVGEKAC